MPPAVAPAPALRPPFVPRAAGAPPRVARRPPTPAPAPAAAPNAARRVAAAAASSTSSPAVPAVPETRERAVAEAADALVASLSSRRGGAPAPPPTAPARPSRGKKTLPKNAKKAGATGFAAPSVARAVVELPLADESAAAAAALVVDLLAALPPALAAAAVVACGDVDVALSLSDALQGTPVGVLGASDDGDDGDDAASSSPAAWLLLVAPPAADAAAVQATLAGWRGRDVVALNAAGVDLCAAPPPAFGRGWRPAYVFQPVAVQGFLGIVQTMGAVLAVRRAGGPAEPVWAILDGAGKLIGRSQRRPSDVDVQDAFLNAAAASSPVTKTAAALKGFSDALRGKK